MRYLLDTCVLSEVVKPRPAQPVLRWLQEQDEPRLFLSVLVLGEIQKGISRLQPSNRRDRLTLWLREDLQGRFRGRIWPVTEDVALAWGRLQGQAIRNGHPIPVMDGLLAATAMTQEAALVTRNVKDISGSPVEILNPWTL